MAKLTRRQRDTARAASRPGRPAGLPQPRPYPLHPGAAGAGQASAAAQMPSNGQTPWTADCSAFTTWCLWNGLYVAYGKPDVVNGLHWDDGFTGTQIQHGRKTTAGGMMKRRPRLLRHQRPNPDARRDLCRAPGRQGVRGQRTATRRARCSCRTTTGAGLRSGGTSTMASNGQIPSSWLGPDPRLERRAAEAGGVGVHGDALPVAQGHRGVARDRGRHRRPHLPLLCPPGVGEADLRLQRRDARVEQPRLRPGGRPDVHAPSAARSTASVPTTAGRSAAATPAGSGGTSCTTRAAPARPGNPHPHGRTRCGSSGSGSGPQPSGCCTTAANGAKRRAPGRAAAGGGRTAS